MARRRTSTSARPWAYKPEEIIKLSDSTLVGLAPTLPKLAKLYEARKVGIVQGVGYDKPNLSHFESMDIWQTGSPKHNISNRLARPLPRPQPGGVERGCGRWPWATGCPPPWWGRSRAAWRCLRSNGFTFFDGGDTDGASEPPRLHDAFLHFSDATLADATAQAMLASERATVNAVRAIQKLGDPKAKPPATLADQVAMAVKLLGSDLGIEIAMVSLGGFDKPRLREDHAPQAAHRARRRRRQVRHRRGSHRQGRRLPADDVLRVRPPGGGGRQRRHRPRHGRPLFVVGDAVAGGLYGEQPSLDTAKLDGNKNLVRSVDFREVYSTVLDGWLRRVPAAEILGTKPADGLHPVGFLR